MNKRTIFELGDYISNKIIYFYKYYKNENIRETSFSNWNVRDVIGHINSWIKFSGDKLESIKLERSFEDVSHVDIEKINKTNYEKYKNKTLEDVANESKIILEKYKNILNLFDDEELMSNKFPTGFSWALWKYMAMDLCIHPLTHIMYQYIKRGDYNEFIKETENSKKYFMEYSENNIKEYYLADLFENKEEKEKQFKQLKEIGKNNKFIEEIIKINME
ncbi:MAG: ClbS/DfsB family four-helix bundle protein [Treponema sp.]|nr:ClbS/DfsB family four-helix bundle protein [Treponema sp.]